MNKDLSQAEAMFKEAIRINDKALKARFALADFYMRSGKRNWRTGVY